MNRLSYDLEKCFAQETANLWALIPKAARLGIELNAEYHGYNPLTYSYKFTYRKMWSSGPRVTIGSYVDYPSEANIAALEVLIEKIELFLAGVALMQY